MDILTLNVSGQGNFQLNLDDPNWRVLSPAGEPIRIIEERSAEDLQRDFKRCKLYDWHWRCEISVAEGEIRCQAIAGINRSRHLNDVFFVSRMPLKDGCVTLLDMGDDRSEVLPLAAHFLTHEEKALADKYGIATVRNINPNLRYSLFNYPKEVISWATDGQIKPTGLLGHGQAITGARWAIAQVNLSREKQPASILYSWHSLRFLEQSFQEHGVMPVV